MHSFTQAYLAIVVLAGSALLASTLFLWETTSMLRFATYLLAASLAGLMRIEVPGRVGIYSLSSIFLLLAMAVCNFSELIVIGFVSTIVQCCVFSATRPRPQRVLFSACAMAITVAITYYPLQWMSNASYRTLLPLGLTIASGLLFVLNTSLLSGRHSLSERVPFFEVWDKWLIGSFGYHLLGAAVAIILSMDLMIMDWRMPLPVLPLSFLIYYYYSAYMKRHVRE